MIGAIRELRNNKKPRAVTQGSLLLHALTWLSALASPHFPERCTEAVAGQTALLLIALACLELAFDFFAVEGIAPLLATRPAVENQIRGDLIAIPILAGRHEGEQVAA